MQIKEHGYLNFNELASLAVRGSLRAKVCTPEDATSRRVSDAPQTSPPVFHPNWPLALGGAVVAMALWSLSESAAGTGEGWSPLIHPLRLTKKGVSEVK